MGASTVQEKGTATVTDDVTDDNETDDNDLMERLERHEMMTDILRVVRSDGKHNRGCDLRGCAGCLD